jgi:hypothetical protein
MSRRTTTVQLFTQDRVIIAQMRLAVQSGGKPWYCPKLRRPSLFPAQCWPPTLSVVQLEATVASESNEHNSRPNPAT